jgi:hypothetical protein
MNHLYATLEEALAPIHADAVPNGSRIVVSWAWWDALSEAERNTYQSRCDTRGLRLSIDHRISRHFVEVSGPDTLPLSSEHRA